MFGTELGKSFVISPGLQEKTDLVALRLTSPAPPRILPVVVYEGERRWRHGGGSPAALGSLGAP